jgi:uncharacterized protein YaaQ
MTKIVQGKKTSQGEVRDWNYNRLGAILDKLQGRSATIKQKCQNRQNLMAVIHLKNASEPDYEAIHVEIPDSTARQRKRSSCT